MLAQVEVVDSVSDYMATLKEVFDFPMLRSFVSRSDFSMVFDALHAVTGAYAGPIFVDELGADPSSIRLLQHSSWPSLLRYFNGTSRQPCTSALLSARQHRVLQTSQSTRAACMQS